MLIGVPHADQSRNRRWTTNLCGYRISFLFPPLCWQVCNRARTIHVPCMTTGTTPRIEASSRRVAQHRYPTAGDHPESVLGLWRSGDAACCPRRTYQSRM